MEFYISPQSGQFYMINVLENQWLSVTDSASHWSCKRRLAGENDMNPGRIQEMIMSAHKNSVLVFVVVVVVKS